MKKLLQRFGFNLTQTSSVFAFEQSATRRNTDSRLSRNALAVLAILLSWPVLLLAHEVRPSIGHLTTPAGTVKLAIELGSAEPLLAGMDLSTVTDTNDGALSGEVDALRALSALQIAARLRAMPEEIFAPMALRIDGVPIALELIHAETDDEPNPELPRTSRVFFEAQLPEGARMLQLDWPAEFGTLILRQIDVEDGYTGFLSGGLSDEIPIAGGAGRGGLANLLSFVPPGFAHVLPFGFDDIVFMLALVLLSSKAAPLLRQIASVAGGHVAVVALGAWGGFTLAPTIAGPILAACIVFVALENCSSDRPGLLRLGVIFAFVLLHGLGFAAELQGLEAQKALALSGVTLGIWIAQLAVIAFALACLLLLRRVGGAVLDQEPRYRRFVVMPASLVIAGLGALWFVQRIL